MGAAIGLLIQKKDTGGSNAFPFVILSIFFVFLIFAIVISFYTYREYKCFMMYGQGAMGGMPVPGAPRNNDSINSDPRGDDYYQGKSNTIYIQNLLILTQNFHIAMGNAQSNPNGAYMNNVREAPSSNNNSNYRAFQGQGVRLGRA